MKYLLFLVIYFSFNLYASTFLKVSIKDQVKYSDNIIIGEVLGLESEVQDNFIITKLSLRADKWLSSTTHSEVVELSFPGGQVGDKFLKIEGAPEFSKGEKVLIFAKDDNGQLWINNLGLSKFTIKNLGKSKIIVNQIFPDIPDVSQMQLSTFYKLVEDVKGVKLQERRIDKYESSIKKHSYIDKENSKGSREPASINNVDKAYDHKFTIFWLLILLSSLLILKKVINKKDDV